MRKAYIFLGAFIVWSLLFWYHYVYNIKQLGATPPSKTEVTPVNPPITTLPEARQLLFKPKNYNLLVIGTTTQLVDSIIAQGNSHQSLQITGYNSPSEQIGLEYDLGLARASELKKLLINELAEDRIEIFSDTISNFTYYKDSLIDALFYEWVDGYEPEKVANYYVINHDTKRVETEAFQELLEKIANRLVETGEKVIIRGHTDEAGKSEVNFTIAHRNAKDIRDVFKAAGVHWSNITTTSSGDDSPVGDNATAIGRKDNRRIEIEIVED